MTTNTSYLDVDAIAAVTRRPERVIGLHFFAPAQTMKLLEVVRTSRCDDAVLATALAIARRIGKIAVVARVCPGFIGNRMLAVRRREVDAMLLEGASPLDIDRVAVLFGFPMGPLRVSDFSGLDLGWSAGTSTSATVRERLCEAGRRGLKVKQGYYDYDERNNPRAAPDVDRIIVEVAHRQGVKRRSLTDQEILNRLIWPLILEGRALLAEGIAMRSSDIDVVWLNGFGWPRFTGDPMFFADQSPDTSTAP